MGFIGTLTNTDNSIVDGSIQNKELQFSDISLGGVTVSLGGTVSEPNFNLTLASNYPSSALVGLISSTQIEGFGDLVGSGSSGSVGGNLTVSGYVYSNQRTTSGGFRLPDWQVYNTSAGALSFYDSTNTAERLHITSSGLMGIGTDNPVSTLDCNGQLSISNNTSSYWLWDRDDSDGRLKLLDSSTSTNERLSVDTSGRLLVGITSALETAAGRQLQVSDANGAFLVLGRDDTTVGNGPALGGVHFYGNDTTNNDWTKLATIQCSSDGVQRDGDNPTRLEFATTSEGESTPIERMRITSGGLVGIGTDNLTSKLQVHGTLGLSASDDLESTFPGGRTKLTSGASGFIINHNDNSDTIFQNQGGETVRITSGGDMGIGIDSPGVKLDIFQFTNTSTDEATTMLRLTNHVGAAAGDGDVTGVNGQRTFIDFAFEDANANFTPQVKIGAQAGQTSGSDAGIESEGFGSFVVYTGKGINSFGSGSLTEKFRVDPDGNVGIGITNPDVLLTVNTTIADAYTNGTGALNTPNGEILKIRNLDTTTDNTGAFASFHARGATSTMSIWYAGNTGGESTGLSGDFVIGNRTGDPEYTERIRIDSAGGYVGIGTDNPTARLEVATSVAGIATVARFRNMSGGGTDQTADIELGLENVTTSNVILRAGKEANHSSSAATDNFFAIHTTLNNTSSEKLRITSGGSVGIGTDNPTVQLDVDNVGSGTTIRINADTSNSASLILAENKATKWEFEVVNGDDNRFRLVNQTGDESLSVLQTGNIGIGTDNPTAKLDVAGSATFGSGNMIISSGGSILADSGGDPAGDAKVTINSNGNADFAGSVTAPRFIGDSDYNIFMGTDAGGSYDPSTGTACYNVAIGYSAGSSTTEGDDNIFLGRCTGKCTTTGSGNVFLGAEAGCHNTCGSCNIAIGYRAGCCSSFDGTITDSTCDNIFIGRYSGYCSCGRDNLSIGTLAGWYSNGHNNIFLGCLSGGGSNSTGSYNIFFGCRAGNGNTTGCINIAIGPNSGSSNSSGCYNIFMGCSAGRGNTTASHNIYIGRNAACRHSTGQCNIFMGKYAGACLGFFSRKMDQSIIIGDCAGFKAGIVDCGSSNRNVWIGHYAGGQNECAGGNSSSTYVGNYAGACTQGSFNTFIGTYSGTGCKNCIISDNIAIGRETGYKIKGNCNIVIGRSAEGGCSNNILIGNCAGNGTFNGLVEVETSSNQIVIGNCDITNFYTKMRSAASTGTNVEWCSTTCELIADTSSCRFKHNIRPFLKGIEIINNIEPVRYKSNDDPEGPDHVGFIAEQIDEIGLTEFVSYDADDTPYSVSYGKMVALLTNGIKELSQELDQVREELSTIKSHIGISTTST